MANFTERAIKAAFLELLSERPLNQITVKDIVERCGINRSSFYYHFQDVPALIDRIVTEETDRIIAEYPTIDSLEMGFQAAIDFAEANRRAVLHVYNSINRDIFEQYLWKLCDYTVLTYYKTAIRISVLSEKDREILLNSYRAQIFGMSMDWLRHGMKEDIRDSVHRFCEWQKQMVEEIIKKN